jgi:hypothetical protein
LEINQSIRNFSYHFFHAYSSNFIPLLFDLLSLPQTTPLAVLSHTLKLTVERV